MLTKKNLLYISGVGTVIAITTLFFFSGGIPLGRCSYAFDMSCAKKLTALMLAIFIPIFIFSIVTYKLKEETFLSWKKFTLIYLFIYLFIIVINPWQPADFSPFEKKSAFMTLVPLYFLISLILIIYKSIKLRGK
jgi:hypothetical protein